MKGGFSTLAVLPSNVAAVEAAYMFSGKLSVRVALVGPSGWGKSHLLLAAADCLRRQTGVSVVHQPAIPWLNNQARPEAPVVLILDDVQDALTRPKERQALRAALEMRARLSRPTMLSFTMDGPSRALKSLLPARNWQIAALKAPQVSERQAVLRRIADREGLSLPDRLYGFLARKVGGNGNSLVGAVQRLRAMQPRWVHLDDEFRAIGMLQPIMADSTGWDVRDFIADELEPLLENLAPVLSVEARRQIVVFFMSRTFHVPEHDIASFFDLSPGKVHAMAVAGERLIQQTGPGAHTLDQCHQHLAKALEIA